MVKQAYTNELELQVAQLLEENAKLKKQQEQVIFFLLSLLQEAEQLDFYI